MRIGLNNSPFLILNLISIQRNSARNVIPLRYRWR